MNLNIAKGQSNKRIKLNNNKGFVFDERSHTYTMNGVKLKSTTLHIKEWAKSFNSVQISSFVANSNKKKGKGLTNPAKIRKFWGLKGSRSSSLGTTGHDYCVMWWLDKENAEPITKLDRNAKKLMEYLDIHFDIVRMEIPKGSAKYAMGYTLDILLKRKGTEDYYIGDFKFSQAFTSEQYKKLKGRLPNKMINELSDYRDVGHDKGIIQLNMYAEFMKEENIDIKGAYLFHIDGLSGLDNYYGDKGYKVYKVPMLPALTKELLKEQEKFEIVEYNIDKNLVSKL